MHSNSGGIRGSRTSSFNYASPIPTERTQPYSFFLRFLVLLVSLIRRREALVYNTPDDHVTRDIREGVAKLGDLRFNVLDSAGLETEAISGTILSRTSEMTANVLARTQLAIFLIDVRDGLLPLDQEVGKWMRKHAPKVRTIVAMNKSESLDEDGLVAAAAGEAYSLGFGDPIAISAENGLGMAELYETILPLLEDYVLQLRNGMVV